MMGAENGVIAGEKWEAGCYSALFWRKETLGHVCLLIQMLQQGGSRDVAGGHEDAG